MNLLTKIMRFLFSPRLLLAILSSSILSFAATTEAQTMAAHHSLTARQQGIIPIAAFTANGDLGKLKAALNKGLDAGLTVNEIKEIIVQLYAYAGFPRSLNGIATFMTVMEERGKKGIKDRIGKEASPILTDKSSLEFGTENQTKLVGQPVTGPLYDFAPAIDKFLKAHLFGDIFHRDVLNWQDRELATVAALASIEGVNPQLKGHIGIAMHNGLTAEQLRELVRILRDECDPKVGENTGCLLDEVLTSSRTVTKTLKEETVNQQHDDGNNCGIFRRGEENAAYALYFTGTSYLNMLSTEGVFIGNVTFEPGCRNFWHIHHKGGQILLVTGGRGWYQEWGKPARELHPGDVVNIPPETKHWHGAANDSWFAHVAVEVPAEGRSNEWLEPVSEEEYKRLK